MAESPRQPVVSVIVPLYNKAAFIGRALDSILSQSFQKFDIVVVDDGSTDDGAEVVRGYADPRIRLIRQANAGPGAARNRGIRESTAPLVAFLDADDEWLPGYLERAVRHLAEYPNCGVTVSGRIEGPSQASLEPRFKEYGFSEEPWRLEPDASYDEMGRAISVFFTSAVVVRREAVEACGGFYEKDRCTLGEDLYLWVQLLLKYSICWAPSPRVWYHTDASDLWVGRKTSRPLSPTLLDPEPVRARCPEGYRPMLERFLAGYAMQKMRNFARLGEYATGLRLLRRYPLARRATWAYVKTWLYVGVMPIWRWLVRWPGVHRMLRKLRGGGGAAARAPRTPLGPRHPG